MVFGPLDNNLLVKMLVDSGGIRPGKETNWTGENSWCQFVL